MRKQLHYVTLFLLFLNTNTLFAEAENYIENYINTYKDIAIREMERSGIPASITLAQGIHESSWGRGELAKNSNNHFGIKCKDYWGGSSFYFKDDDYDRRGNLIKSCFRAYENPEKSYLDHTEFLMKTAHYQRLFKYSNTDYRRWAKGLKSCGYATDKEYANKLIRTIEKYKLYKYDRQGEQVEQRVLVSAPTYKIPNGSIHNLVIRTDKNNSETFSSTDIPKAIFIPDDYERKFEKVESMTAENHQKQQMAQDKTEAEIIPLNYENEGIIQEKDNDYEKALTPIKNNVVQTTIEKESIIPAAFASTKRTYHLSRKPRASNSNLR
jgi:Mannosyl-glycoprotein endo-beta-N-acetylglucosaminidase